MIIIVALLPRQAIMLPQGAKNGARGLFLRNLREQVRRVREKRALEVASCVNFEKSAG